MNGKSKISVLAHKKVKINGDVTIVLSLKHILSLKLITLKYCRNWIYK